MRRADFKTTWVALAVLWAFLPVGGCSGLQARGAMATAMPVNAGLAQQVVSAQATLTPAQARADLAWEGPIIKGYFNAATVNVFAYWFDPNKTVLCTAATYYDLSEAAAFVAEPARRAASTTQPITDSEAIHDAIQAAKAIIITEGYREGK